MSSEELADTIAAVNAKIDAQIAQSRQLAQESARLETEASQTMATVTSADGRVTITCLLYTSDAADE